MAAKAAAPRTVVKEKSAMGEKSVFTVLGSRVREKEKKEKKMQAEAVPAVVVDDWEKAVEEEELRELAQELEVREEVVQ